MSTFFTILLVLVGGFIIWWFKGAREAYVLKDKVLFILTSKYGLDRIEAKYLFDGAQKYVIDLHRSNYSAMEIAEKLYSIHSDSQHY